MKDFFDYSFENPWFFTNYGFLFVLGLFLIIYGLLSRNQLMKKVYVILFSLFFYYKSSGPYLAIFVAMIIMDYNIALLIEKVQSQIYRKTLLICSVIFSLSFLLYFKYAFFFTDIFNGFFDTSFSIAKMFLPIGISFYTFQSISYIVDVYHKKIVSSKSFIDYTFYMTFFPHLVAGPIVRAKDFMPQINHPLELGNDRIADGFFRIMSGLLKKLLIADFLAKYVDLVHTGPAMYSGMENLISMYAYAFQIYFDFSGYSDIAIGIALLMGYTLNENFDAPYRAKNISEFWRKWHISLSSWLRDYIYIPMGGNRKGERYTYIFLMLTMLVGGLWHGADWKFILWGALHGLGLASHKLYLKFRKKDSSSNHDFKTKMVNSFITFNFVAILWVLFRATSFSSAYDSFNQMIHDLRVKDIYLFFLARKEIIYMLLTSVLIVFCSSALKPKIKALFLRIPLYIIILIFLLVLQIILELKDQEIQPFIYFQF